MTVAAALDNTTLPERLRDEIACGALAFAPDDLASALSHPKVYKALRRVLSTSGVPVCGYKNLATLTSRLRLDAADTPELWLAQQIVMALAEGVGVDGWDHVDIRYWDGEDGTTPHTDSPSARPWRACFRICAPPRSRRRRDADGGMLRLGCGVGFKPVMIKLRPGDGFFFGCGEKDGKKLNPYHFGVRWPHWAVTADGDGDYGKGIITLLLDARPGSNPVPNFDKMRTAEKILKAIAECEAMGDDVEALKAGTWRGTHPPELANAPYLYKEFNLRKELTAAARASRLATKGYAAHGAWGNDRAVAKRAATAEGHRRRAAGEGIIDPWPVELLDKILDAIQLLVDDGVEIVTGKSVLDVMLDAPPHVTAARLDNYMRMCLKWYIESRQGGGAPGDGPSSDDGGSEDGGGEDAVDEDGADQDGGSEDAVDEDSSSEDIPEGWNSDVSMGG